MKKSIAIICEYILIPERIGGMDRFFVAYDKSLKEKGYEVTWFFKNAVKFDFYKNLTIIDTNNIEVSSFFINYCSKNNLKYDVVNTHFTELCTKSYKRIKKLMNDVYIIAVDHNPRPMDGFTIKKQLKNKIKGKLYHKYIDAFIAVSEYSKENLIKDFGAQITSKIKIIFNGIETQKYIQKANFNTHNNFIVACHLRKEKGVQDIIEAVNILPNDLLEKIKITIYGEGPYENVLKQKVRDNNLENRIVFKGNTDQLESIYYQYDYLIHPSYGETFCFTVVESLMSNLPVITTNKAGNVLNLVIDKENGYTFDIGDVIELSSVLKKIVIAKEQIEGEIFYKEIENKFSISTMVNNHLKLLECI